MISVPKTIERSLAKRLPAEIRAEIRGLHSRIEVLRKALSRTTSGECFDLYWKAILVAEFDIQELEASI